MSENPYRLLAQRLDALPNGFPATEDGVELRLLARLFTPEEALLAAALRLTPEAAADIAARVGGDPVAVAGMLKSMAKRGLIKAVRRSADFANGVRPGLDFAIMPFVVGIYEMQMPVLDAELARLFEDYYRRAFVRVVDIDPPVHRVVPVHRSVKVDMEVHPYESAADIVAANKAWGVLDCICRKQKALIGEACAHPVDVCMALSPVPGVFEGAGWIRSLTEEEAMGVLQRAAGAGLVHTVSNSQEGITYICNCCTCSCGILRGLSELGRANVVARSAFVNTVDEDTCQACGTCVDECQFGAMSLDLKARVDAVRCVGCGVCVLACPEGALSLVRRPESEILPPPVTEADWRSARAAARGIDLARVL